MAHDAGPFRRYVPGPWLSGFVDFLWTYEHYVPPHPRERVLPTGTMELLFTLGADGRVAASVAGARSTSLTLDTSRPFSVIAVHFKPGGGFPFFGVPSGELHDRHLTLDLVWGGYATSLRDRLWEAKTPERRFRILERALVDRAHGRVDAHPGVRYALGVFDRSIGACPVGDVVQRIGLSSRRFVDLFRAEVGLSPKVFCRIRRFNEALRRIEELTDVDWVDVALSCGYFDQAHFNHDFRSFSGISPSRYLRHRTARRHVAITD
jgi:AraC-like DNA-binding protein